MRRPSICDIPITSELKVLFFDAGIIPVCFYWNGSIPPEVVLTVKGWDKAFLADTPAEAIEKAESAIGGGL